MQEVMLLVPELGSINFSAEIYATDGAIHMMAKVEWLCSPQKKIGRHVRQQT
jgi:hypothetical protein